MSAVADVLDSACTVISWLDRDPFGDQDSYRHVAKVLSEISLILATNAQRDRFAEKPVDVIV